MLVRWCFEVVDEVMMKLTSVKLVDTADPLEVALRKIVEGDEVVVTGNTVNRSNTTCKPTDSISPAQQSRVNTLRWMLRKHSPSFS